MPFGSRLPASQHNSPTRDKLVFGRTGRLSHNQLRIDQQLARIGARFRLTGNESFEGDVADPVSWNVHRCKGWGAKFCQPDVVKASDRDLLGDANATFAKITKHSNRHKVVHANDRRGAVGGAEQLMGGMTSSLQSVLGGHGLYCLATKFANRFKEGLFALVDWSETRVVAEKGHSPVSEAVEILNDPVHAFAVIDSD